MAHKVICYGDSNTYGACGFVGGRHPADSRWTGIIQNSGLYDVVNLGENGREIPSDQWELNELTEILRREGDFDLLAVMLGTNDLLENPDFTAVDVAKRMERFLKRLMEEAGLASRKMKLRLIAPPAMQEGAWADRPELLTESRNLGKEYQRIARRVGVAFTDASGWEIPVIYDGVHFTEDGHRIFVEKIREEIRI